MWNSGTTNSRGCRSHSVGINHGMANVKRWTRLNTLGLQVLAPLNIQPSLPLLDYWQDMAYAQWVIIVISNKSSRDINITQVKLVWGKFHGKNKDDEIQKSEVAKTIK